ncbi:hypothetical protein [Sphingomonas sp. LM7]|uniref:hypothetical protein n=1 Tax=Sphingomonas sp. LM7 TaxID=1938607 RepID=UPI000983AB36|nr:hypothetical protein [Sphingomonas sp. LM7]AQR73283.1 hypothetical protein BXU08_06160 [Sphingomonas sp. LM7]
MIIRTLGLGLFVMAATPPAIAQDAPSAAKPASSTATALIVQSCPSSVVTTASDSSAQPATAKPAPGGKVSVQDLSLRTASAAPAPTGKVSVQDMHRAVPSQSSSSSSTCAAPAAPTP